MKKIIYSLWIAAFILTVVALVLNLLPDLRRRGEDVYQRYGGWTEEARAQDPAGFVAYAEAELRSDAVQMQEAQQKLTQAVAAMEVQAGTARRELQAAAESAEALRLAYQAAQQTDSFPVDVAGATLTREELIEQARQALAQRRWYEQLLVDFLDDASAAEQFGKQLRAQVTSSEAALVTLAASKELVRLEQLAGSMAAALTRIHDLTVRNEQVLQESPVELIEAHLERAGEENIPAASGQVDVMSFLEAGE
jgi:hypothetical protein